MRLTGEEFYEKSEVLREVRNDANSVRFPSLSKFV